MEVNDKVTVDFIDLDYEGRAVCKLEDNFAIFVDGGLKGEKAIIEITELKKNYGFGKIIKFLEYSPFRVQPSCPHFEKCGGCNLMHLDYETSLEYKRKIVKDTIKRISSFDVMVEKTIGMKNYLHYRNKLEFHFDFKGGRIRAGFYDEKTHMVCDLTKCMLLPDIALEIIIFLKSVFTIHGVPIYKEKDHRGCIRHVIVRINRKNEIMVVFVTNTNYLKKQEEIIPALIKKFPSIVSVALSFDPANQNAHLGKKTEILYGATYLEDSLLGNKFLISPESFYQVNDEQTEKLYQTVLDYAALTGNETLIDAYCGIGTISLALAKKAKKVYGIEIFKEAVVAAKENSKINKIENTEFITGPCEVEIQKLIDKQDIDLLVCDPPRKGLEKEFIDSVGKMGIKRIIYVSCNIRTCARDISYFGEYGYQPLKVTPVDMFPLSTHVECVVLMTHTGNEEIVSLNKNE